VQTDKHTDTYTHRRTDADKINQYLRCNMADAKVDDRCHKNDRNSLITSVYFTETESANR